MSATAPVPGLEAEGKDAAAPARHPWALSAEDPYGDLLGRLQGEDAQSHREQLLSHLQGLEQSLVHRSRHGVPSSDYDRLEAALLAVRAGIDTLQALSATQALRAETPLTHPQHFFKGEAA